MRASRDGVELKIGPLHAFMPKSHTERARDESPELLVGRTLVCEVIVITGRVELEQTPVPGVKERLSIASGHSAIP